MGERGDERGAVLTAAASPGEGGGQDGEGGTDAVGREVGLGEPDGVEAELVSQTQPLQRVLYTSPPACQSRNVRSCWMAEPPWSLTLPGARKSRALLTQAQRPLLCCSCLRQELNDFPFPRSQSRQS